MNYDKILMKVEKPSRYIGGEINSITKEIKDDTIRYCFSFPDSYEVGMSYLGLHILYNLMNDIEDVYCERVFSPWPDMEEILREEKMKIASLETFTPLNEFDIIGFTLQYELSYTNILNLMDMGGVPLRSKDRADKDPLVLAGGPCAFNPEPLAEIVDVFFIGESEENYIEFFNVYRKYKKNEISKEDLLFELSQIQGIYVPSLYDVSYNEDNTLKEMVPNREGVPAKVKKAIIKDFDNSYAPKSMIVPFSETVHNRAMVEIFRGCTRGCRFCQAGMIYRPVRERSKETIKEISKTILENTGYEEVSLTSLSTLDHSDITDTIRDMVAGNQDDKIAVSLPSLRIDSKSLEVLEELQRVKKTSLTFAPEAGSQRMRDVINKGVTQENIEETFTSIFNNGCSRIKLYFMIGLPTETLEDVADINEVANTAIHKFRKEKSEDQKKNLTVTVSTACFVPKPFTPFQWMAQNSMEDFNTKIKHLKKEIVSKKIVYNYHDPKTSYLEAVFARGDRKLNEVMIKAFEKGCKFDGWYQHFKFDTWTEIFEEMGIDMDFYATRERSFEELFPWDIIDAGVEKSFLKAEYEKAIKAELTEDCRETCSACGVNIAILGGDTCEQNKN